MNVALTYNIKPEEEQTNEILSSNEIVPPKFNSPIQPSKSFNDLYAEWDSFETIDAVRSALARYHNVTMIEANEDAFEKLRTTRPDIVFNIAEGMNGISREAQIPAILDMLNIPYTGSDPLTLASCLDKSRAKEILLYNRIKTPMFLTVNDIRTLEEIKLSYPVIVKPVAEGSSKGIFNSSYVANYNNLVEVVSDYLTSYKQPVLIEEYLPGREFTVALLGNGDEAIALPIVEINFSELPEGTLPIYSFEAKWIFDKRDNPLDIFTCPAQVNKLLEEKIKDIALKTYHTLKCKDWSRIDIRLDADEEPNIIEVNPLPGILPDPKDNSCYPKAARAYGLNYEEMINQVLYVSAKRYKLI